VGGKTVVSPVQASSMRELNTNSLKHAATENLLTDLRMQCNEDESYISHSDVLIYERYVNVKRYITLHAGRRKVTTQQIPCASRV
jgi:two-component sensor histidine kinase